MSYCRWSSMDFKCDLYCYESDFGYETHVATNRVVDDLTPIDFSSSKAFLETSNKQIEELQTVKVKMLNLPYDGQDFIDTTLEDFKARLIQGYGQAFRKMVSQLIWSPSLS